MGERYAVIVPYRVIYGNETHLSQQQNAAEPAGIMLYGVEQSIEHWADNPLVQYIFGGRRVVTQLSNGNIWVSQTVHSAISANTRLIVIGDKRVLIPGGTPNSTNPPCYRMEYQNNCEGCPHQRKSTPRTSHLFSACYASRLFIAHELDPQLIAEHELVPVMEIAEFLPEIKKFGVTPVSLNTALGASFGHVPYGANSEKPQHLNVETIANNIQFVKDRAADATRTRRAIKRCKVCALYTSGQCNIPDIPCTKYLAPRCQRIKDDPGKIHGPVPQETLEDLYRKIFELPGVLSHEQLTWIARAPRWKVNVLGYHMDLKSVTSDLKNVEFFVDKDKSIEVYSYEDAVQLMNAPYWARERREWVARGTTFEKTVQAEAPANTDSLISGRSLAMYLELLQYRSLKDYTFLVPDAWGIGWCTPYFRMIREHRGAGICVHSHISQYNVYRWERLHDLIPPNGSSTPVHYRRYYKQLVRAGLVTPDQGPTMDTCLSPADRRSSTTDTQLQLLPPR